MGYVETGCDWGQSVSGCNCFIAVFKEDLREKWVKFTLTQSPQSFDGGVPHLTIPCRTKDHVAVEEQKYICLLFKGHFSIYLHNPAIEMYTNWFGVSWFVVEKITDSDFFTVVVTGARSHDVYIANAAILFTTSGPAEGFYVMLMLVNQ